MSSFTCENCGKEFSKKSYNSHMRRKTPCSIIKKLSVLDIKINNIFNDSNIAKNIQNGKYDSCGTLTM